MPNKKHNSYCFPIIKMTKTLLSTAALFLISNLSVAAENNKPNVIFIFADDMGIGDVSHMGGKAPTPALDYMAKNGLQFTEAHTTSSVCTPSRYSLMTGRYSWRTSLQKGVFMKPKTGYLIEDNAPNIARLFKNNGYNTAMVGKWHIGFKWPYLEQDHPDTKKFGADYNIDFTQPIGTPRRIGFDYFYGIHASLDMPPYMYFENDKAIEQPTKSMGYITTYGPNIVTKKEGAKKRIGPATETFATTQVLKNFAEKSVDYINKVAKDEKPFFLYVPLTSPHTPISPSKEFQGKGFCDYADLIMETDWVVQQILNTLKQNNIAENTLVLFSADNGCSPAANIPRLIKKGHYHALNLRGHKADIYQGGFRVPTYALWPSSIKPGTTSDRLTSLADFYATAAELVGHTPEDHEGVDSVSFLPTLKGEEVTRTPIVLHSISGHFAIRKDNWKLCFSSGSAGWSAPKRGDKNSPKWQLFNLEGDISETTNLYNKHPEIVNELHTLMKKYIADGRSTPGDKQSNDITTIILDKK